MPYMWGISFEYEYFCCNLKKINDLIIEAFHKKPAVCQDFIRRHCSVLKFITNYYYHRDFAFEVALFKNYVIY